MPSRVKMEELLQMTFLLLFSLWVRNRVSSIQPPNGLELLVLLCLLSAGMIGMHPHAQFMWY